MVMIMYKAKSFIFARGSLKITMARDFTEKPNDCFLS